VRARAASVAAVASLLLIAGGVIAVALQTERHQLGSNWVRPVARVADAVPGARVCQPGMAVPAGTGAVGLRVFASDGPGPELRLAIRSAGQPEVRGVLPAGWRDGDIVVPVPELGTARRDARVCLEHDGDGRIAIAGGPGIGPPASVGGRDVNGMIRLEYTEAEARTWFPVVPEVVDRLAVARDALPGPASLPLFALLALGVLGGSVMLVLREGRR
jgi:hypothetical protein